MECSVSRITIQIPDDLHKVLKMYAAMIDKTQSECLCDCLIAQVRKLAETDERVMYMIKSSGTDLYQS